MRKLTILLLISIFIGGCSSQHSQNQSMIDDAESSMCNLEGKSTIKILSQITPAELDKEQSNSYTKLLTLTNIQNGVVMNYDSLLNPVIEYYKERNDSIEVSELVYSVAFAYRSNKEFEKSNEYIDSAFSFIHDKYKLKFVLLKISNLRDEKSLDELLVLAENESNRLIDSERYNELLRLYVFLANNYLELDVWDNVDMYLHKAIAILDQTDWKYPKSRYITNLTTKLSFKMYEKGDFDRAYYYASLSYDATYDRAEKRYANFVKSIIKQKQGDVDSSYYFAGIASESDDPFVAFLANKQLHDLSVMRGDLQLSTRYITNAVDSYDVIIASLRTIEEVDKYEQILLEKENMLLKSEKKNKDLIIIVILSIVMMVGIVVYNSIKRRQKRQTEINILNKSKELEQENKLLKHEQEISLLNEKEAILRESLFRKINLFKKIPSVSAENTIAKSKRIALCKDDWNELVQTINDAYPNFISNLKKQYTKLSDDDIYFCCFLKVNVNLKDLSEIYCVSKAAITKRKYRIKTEKMGIEDPAISLDDQLKNHMK